MVRRKVVRRPVKSPKRLPRTKGTLEEKKAEVYRRDKTIIVQGGIPENVKHDWFAVNRDAGRVMDKLDVEYKDAGFEYVAPDTNFSFEVSEKDAPKVVKALERLKKKYPSLWIHAWGEE